MSEKGKRDVIEAHQPGMLGSTAGPIPSIKKIRKTKEKKKRVRKRDRIKRMTRKRIERLLAKGKRTWMSINTVLRHGKWRGMKDEDEDK